MSIFTEESGKLESFNGRTQVNMKVGKVNIALFYFKLTYHLVIEAFLAFAAIQEQEAPRHWPVGNDSCLAYGA